MSQCHSPTNCRGSFLLVRMNLARAFLPTCMCSLPFGLTCLSSKTPQILIMEHHDWTSPLSPCAQSGLCGGPTARLTGDANVCIYGAFQVSHISPSQMLLGSSGERGVEGEERRRDDKIWSLAWRGSGPMPLLMLPSGLLDTCTVASGVQNLAGSQGT